MTTAESYRHCVDIARARARNFYYSFVLLSTEQRNAICAIYAFMRECDDLSDGDHVADRAGAIARWQAELGDALEGRYAESPVWPAFHDAVRRYSIPRQYFDEMIAGVRSDLEPRRIQTFNELYRYCYQVASVVGLTIIHIFGFESDEALGLAEKCGIAFQLTNIIRDVREDALNDRIYLPAEDLVRFGVDERLLRSGAADDAFRELMRFEGQRAEDHYCISMPLVGMVGRKSRSSLWALIEIYHRLFRRIRATGYDVLNGRIRISTAEKFWVLAQAMVKY